jgi:hypothetical protein
MCDPREPLEFDGRWLWHPVPDGVDLDDQPDYLPRPLFDRLRGYLVSTNPKAQHRVKAYAHRDSALEALREADFREGGS